MRIPYPPSVNHYYKLVPTGNGKWGMIVCKKGKEHQVKTWAICKQNGIRPTDKKLAVHFVVTRPDKRRRDLSNLLKCLEDSLTKGGMWHDDSQIIDLRITWVNEHPEEFMTIEVGDEKT